MSILSTSRVTFARPFQLPGMDRAHAPGTFEVVIEQEALDVSWPAYRLTTTIMLTSGSRVEAWPISEAQLNAALADDEAAGS
ncbi:hypothetical protein VE25_18025 [Devosia geojensis]|uniref:Uncharacterized protein n=1 Tax=Devosia geojensis TaxID=443610 RepID=A0A0F5FNM4_9HYPH|nr:hypothetical protein [Devosia geojensis]KKB10446.1 hypothetical protein VE25_18025 [Devosia geojensis]